MDVTESPRDTSTMRVALAVLAFGLPGTACGSHCDTAPPEDMFSAARVPADVSVPNGMPASDILIEVYIRGYHWTGSTPVYESDQCNDEWSLIEGQSGSVRVADSAPIALAYNDIDGRYEAIVPYATDYSLALTDNEGAVHTQLVTTPALFTLTVSRNANLDVVVEATPPLADGEATSSVTITSCRDHTTSQVTVTDGNVFTIPSSSLPADYRLSVTRVLQPYTLTVSADYLTNAVACP